MIKKSIHIKGRMIGDQAPMLIIAEIACAHEGRFEDLLKLIDLAGQTGADAVKLQVVDAAAHMTRHHQLYDLLLKLVLTPAQWREAADYVRKRTSLLLLADIYDEASVSTVLSLDPDMVKIHSADLSNVPLVKQVAGLNKPTLIGVGASTQEEIGQALHVFQQHYKGEFVGLMHGYQGFPTRLEELNILQIPGFRQAFDMPVGFLDHTEGDTDESLYISLAARAAGAFAVEKHIVLDRAKKGIDHESALSLDHFRTFVRWVRQTEKALGSAAPLPLTVSEKKYRDMMKKNIVAARDIKEGEILDAGMIAFKRSSPGISADQLPQVLGRKLKRSVHKDDNIVLEVLS